MKLHTYKCELCLHEVILGACWKQGANCHHANFAAPSLPNTPLAQALDKASDAVGPDWRLRHLVSLALCHADCGRGDEALRVLGRAQELAARHGLKGRVRTTGSLAPLGSSHWVANRLQAVVNLFPVCSVPPSNRCAQSKNHSKKWPGWPCTSRAQQHPELVCPPRRAALPRVRRQAALHRRPSSPPPLQPAGAPQPQGLPPPPEAPGPPPRGERPGNRRAAAVWPKPRRLRPRRPPRFLRCSSLCVFLRQTRMPRLRRCSGFCPPGPN